MTFLEKVLEEKKKKVDSLKKEIPVSELKYMAAETPKKPFYDVFSERFPDRTKIIAEVKKVSPSRGLLVNDVYLSEILLDYEKGGASAISIITEEKYFQGSIEYVAEAKKTVDLPVIRKDFIVDEYEVYQAGTAGADAVLLIGEALDKGQIAELIDISSQVGIDVLLEIHSMKMYEKVADLKGFILGVNNRNLDTLKVDLAVAYEIIKNIPVNLPVVVESGIETRDHIECFMRLGVSGFLIGTSLMISENPREKLRELIGKT